MNARDPAPILFRLGSLGMALLSFGCTQTSTRNVQQIADARRALAAKQYSACESGLTPYIRSGAGAPQVAEALYLRGQCRLMTRQREQAREDFQQGLRLAEDRALRAYLEAQLGNMAYDDESYSAACAYYGQAVSDLPSGPSADRILFQYAMALQRGGRFAEARQIFARVYKEHPASEWASTARIKEAWDEDYFTVQCGAFSRIDLAHQAAARLRQRGVDALAYPERRGSGTRYVVRVGKFPTYAQASRKLDQVRGVQGDAFIVP